MTVIAYPDPLVEARGHRPGSPDIEQVTLSALGPAATWLWTRLARIAAHRPSTVVDMADLAASLGLGTELGPNSTAPARLAMSAKAASSRRCSTPWPPAPPAASWPARL